MSFRRIRQSFRYGVGALVVNAALALAVLAGTRPAAADPLTILALGDSLTAGYGLEQEDAFPVKLEAALRARGHDVTVINGGVSGDTSAGGLTRLDWALAAAPGGMPDAMILELGANDGLRGLDPEATEENLNAIIRRARDEGVAVLLTGMLAPPNLGRDYGDEFRGLFPELAEKHGVAFYPFFLDGVAADPALNQEDGIHPNPKGVDIIVERMLPHVERLIAGD
mgnify:CR=1 FL=1